MRERSFCRYFVVLWKLIWPVRLEGCPPATVICGGEGRKGGESG